MVATRIVAAAVIFGSCASEPARTTVTSSASSSVSLESAPSTVAPIVASTTIEETIETASTSRVNIDIDAADLARELSTVERAAAAGDAGVGVRQQLLYRYLAAHSSYDEVVLASVDDDVRPSIERIVAARQLAQARQAANPNPSPPSTTLPAWTVVDPLPAAELLADYHDAETATGIAWYWLAAIHLQETRMGRIIGTSSAGAVGPMQFLPTTWEHCCTGDPAVPRDAIIGAATYLAQSGGPADMRAALHEYNPNDSYVATVTAFAENLRDSPQLYLAYREWQVFYTASAGTIRLPVGYSASEPIDAATYLAQHPGDAG
ncbi:MAG: lytic transglycosylase domain-containing protein [Ilumatobacteraceae bacterium]